MLRHAIGKAWVMRGAPFAAIALALCVAVGAEAGDAKESPAIDWQSLVLRATGSGPPDVNALNPAQARLGAEKAARADALKILMSEVQAVSITASRTVGEEMASEETRGKVEAILRGYKVAAKRYYSDMGIELDVEVGLAPLADLFASSPPPDPSKPRTPKFTGVVFDARKLKVVPALQPRVLDDSAEVLYSIGTLSAQSRKAAGVCGFVRRLEDALKDPRVADKPLVIKVIKAEGSDIVISREQRKKLADSSAVLADGRVIIVGEPDDARKLR